MVDFCRRRPGDGTWRREAMVANTGREAEKKRGRLVEAKQQNHHGYRLYRARERKSRQGLACRHGVKARHKHNLSH